MLELTGVSKDFDGLRAVDEVSLVVPRGQIVGLIGPNGSGKSTLINLIAGSIRLTEGQIVFDGEDITGLAPNEVSQRGLARSYQEPSLFFKMSVLDNALLPVREQRGEQPWYAPLRRLWRQEERDNAAEAEGVLRRVQLRDHYDHAASELSGGQMKLLEIARSLMGDPKLMLLDEPTAGVAPNLAYDIFKQIEAMRDNLGITFLIVEHRLEILFDFVDLVYVMHMGRVLMRGTPDEVAANAEVREVYFGE